MGEGRARDMGERACLHVVARIEEDEGGGDAEHPSWHEVGGRRALDWLEPRRDGEDEEGDDAGRAHLREGVSGEEA